MTKFFKSFTILFICLTSCDQEDKFLGSLQVKNAPGFHIDLYQEQEFDSSVAITYTVYKNETPVYGPKFLIGTSDFEREDLGDFTAGCYDSIVYLTFIDPTKVYALYDIKTKQSIDLNTLPKQDTLIENRFKKNTSGLTLTWYD